MNQAFQCKTDKTMCIPKRKRCDSVVDCEGGSDEEDCEEEHRGKYLSNITPPPSPLTNHHLRLGHILTFKSPLNGEPRMFHKKI